MLFKGKFLSQTKDDELRKATKTDLVLLIRELEKENGDLAEGLQEEVNLKWDGQKRYDDVRQYVQKWVAWDDPDEGETATLALIKDVKESEEKAQRERGKLLHRLGEVIKKVRKLETEAHYLAQLYGHGYVGASNVVEPHKPHLRHIRDLLACDLNIDNMLAHGCITMDCVDREMMDRCLKQFKFRNKGQ